MRIATLTVHDWMAFAGEQRLKLPDGPIAVTARYVSDPRRSNWAGKTAFLEAIGWCVHGTHRKRLDDDVINYDANGCAVDLTFTPVGDRTLRVRRSRVRGQATRVEVYVGDEHYTGEKAQAVIDDMLRLTSADLEATTWFKQGDAEAIVGLTSGKRRATVERWLDLERWSKAGKLARERVTNTANKVAVESQIVSECQAALLTAEQVAGLRVDVEVLRNDIAELERSTDVGSSYAVLDRLTKYNRAEERARTTAERARAARTVLAEIQKPDVDLEALTASAVEARAKIAGIDREGRELGQIVRAGSFAGDCPLVRAPCPSAEFVTSKREAMVERMAELSDSLSAERAVESDASAKIRSVQALKDAHRDAVSKYNTALANAREAKAELDALTKPDDDEVGEANEAIDGSETARAAIGEKQQRIGSINRQIFSNDERIVQLKNAKAREAKAVEEHSTAVLVSRAFASTGISARIAAEQLLGLEERANAGLADSDLSFSFAWERELRDLAPSCEECGFAFKGQRDKACPKCAAPRLTKRADELEILVDDGTPLEDVSAKSGGARTLVAAAIRLAGGLMLRELRGSPAAWAVVDEPFGFLDATNREALARTFTSMLGSFGLEQAFIVSHDAALLDAIPTKLVIVRDGTKSEIVVE